MGGGMPGMGGAPQIMSSPLDAIAAEMASKPRPSQRRAEPPRRAAPKAQAFTPLPSGEVGSSFGPGGLNPGPRGAGAASAPPPAFGGGAYDEDYGGHVTGPPVYFAGEPDEDEEMSITELALMDHAAHTGHSPEDLVMQYDASTAEEMRDEAMRKFYERQQARRPGAGTNDPFAPAGRRQPSGPTPLRRNDDPAAAGGALAQRLANRRRREEEEERRARAQAEPASTPPAARVGEAEDDDGALSRALARRRQALNLDQPPSEPEPAAAPGRPQGTSRATVPPSLRAVPSPLAVEDDDAPSLEDMAAATPVRRSTRPAKSAAARPSDGPPTTRAGRAPAAKAAAKAPAAKAAKAPAAKVAKAVKAPATKGKTSGATLVKPAAKASVAKAAAKAVPKAKAGGAGKVKTLFCVECGEKNPAIAKFCFSCGTRLVAPGN